MPTVRHADYIGSWHDVLREDHRAIVRAASAASKAADFLLSLGQQAAPAQEHCAGPTTLRRPHQAVDATAEVVCASTAAWRLCAHQSVGQTLAQSSLMGSRLGCAICSPARQVPRSRRGARIAGSPADGQTRPA